MFYFFFILSISYFKCARVLDIYTFYCYFYQPAVLCQNKSGHTLNSFQLLFSAMYFTFQVPLLFQLNVIISDSCVREQ